MTRSEQRSPLSSVTRTAAPNRSLGPGVQAPRLAAVNTVPPPALNRTSTAPPPGYDGSPTTTSGTSSPSRSPVTALFVASQPAMAAEAVDAVAVADAVTPT